MDIIVRVLKARLFKNVVGIAQLVRAPDCGSGGHRFDSDYPPHFYFFYLFSKTARFIGQKP